MDNSILMLLESIRDDCDGRKRCEGCPYSCKYYVTNDGKRDIRYSCAIQEIPERWQLETMEGLNYGR